MTADDITAGIADHTDRTGPFSFGLLDFSQMSQTLEMFASDEDSEIKQSPQLLVIDNHQATIFVGETIRFAETDSASNQSGGVEVGIREATNSPVDTGFQLLVRPHIVAGEDKVVLTVIPKAESLSGTGNTIAGFDDFTNGVASIQLPRVQSSTLVTKLILKHGQTAVLGGMIQETQSETKHKVPLLGDIPLLGWAFKWKSSLKSKNNLLIFLTVCIVRSDSDVKDIYTVYGGKYGGKTFEGMQKEGNGNWHRTKESGYQREVKTGAAASDL
jgi:general secretion pathway protein D